MAASSERHTSSVYEQLLSKISDLERQVEILENHSRRNNLKIFGLEEARRETYDVCASRVVDLLNDYAPFKRWCHDDIERAHRLGRANRNSKRPRSVIVKFF